MYKHNKSKRHQGLNLCMGRGGHLATLRPLQYFALEADRQLHQHLEIQDNAIIQLKLLYAKVYRCFDDMRSMYHNACSHSNKLLNENVVLERENVDLRIKNQHLHKKICKITMNLPKKYLSHTQKRKRLQWLAKRQASILTLRRPMPELPV